VRPREAAALISANAAQGTVPPANGHPEIKLALPGASDYIPSLGVGNKRETIMSINVIRAFFKWCTIINGGLLILWSVLLRYAGDWVFGMHSGWIPITRDAFHSEIYLLLGFFKIIVIVFNLVPYLALVIVGRGQTANKPRDPS